MRSGRDVATAYDEWYDTPWGAYADAAEKRLLDHLARPRPGETVLDVGCGTGRYLHWLHERGLRATGVDVCLDMVEAARSRLSGPGVPGRAFVADAGTLPFTDSAFNLVIAVTSLEFMQTPQRALQEMWRVCRGRLFLGVLSRHSLYARLIRRRGPASSLAKARLYGVSELLKLVGGALGPCKCRWRTALLAPQMHSTATVALTRAIDTIPGTGRLPWGAYIGLVVHGA
jgi:SAM-dependent methyltransferase